MTTKKSSAWKYLGLALIVLVVGTIEFYLYMVLNLLCFGFLPCGEQILHAWYPILYGFIFLIFFFFLHFYLARLCAGKNNKPLSWILWAFSIGSVTMLIYYGTFVFNISMFYQDFDRVKWKSSKEKPVTMVRTIFEDRRFIGKTKEEVVKELGESDKHPYVYELYYNTDADFSPLIFEFRDGKVVKYTLLCLD